MTTNVISDIPPISQKKKPFYSHLMVARVTSCGTCTRYTNTTEGSNGGERSAVTTESDASYSTESWSREASPDEGVSGGVSVRF